MEDLEKSIWQTICWFSLFDYPMTSFEIWKWLWRPKQKYTLFAVRQKLEESQWLKSHLENDQGFYSRRQSSLSIQVLIKKRRRSFLDTVRKFKKVKKIIWWFNLLPMIKAVGVVNSMSWWQTNKQSDIDLLVIVQPGYIWLARLLLVTPFAWLKKRPGVSKEIDPFCFTFFISQEKMNLEKITDLEIDPYLIYWLWSVVPVFSRTNEWQQFFQANLWVKKYLPQTFMRAPHQELMRAGQNKKNYWPKFLNQIAKKIQEKYFPELIKKMKNQDSRVIVNDNMLKFHTEDRRQELKEAWKKLIDQG